MSEGTWYIDPEAGAVSAEDDAEYDEAYGPDNPHPEEGRLVEDDEGVRSDTTSEAVASVATWGHGVEVSRGAGGSRHRRGRAWLTKTWSISTSFPRTRTSASSEAARPGRLTPGDMQRPGPFPRDRAEASVSLLAGKLGKL